MRRKIPSLGALQAFESAARFSSFTRAAENLNITQSAVSRHVRALEDQFGLKLFRRSKQRATLTAAGAEYWPEICAGLNQIEASTARLQARRRRDAVLNLAALPTFAAKWLVPRLSNFAEHHPEIDINLSVRTEPADFAGSDVDAAIFFGMPTRAGMTLVKLIGDDLIPVCSPTLLQGQLAPLTPAQFAEHRLLELAIPGSWSNWFRVNEREDLDRGPDDRYEYFMVGIQAAISGMGILLVPHFLVIEDIREGRLAIACSRAVRADSAYYLMYPESRKDLPAIRTFHSWIQQAAEKAKRECTRLRASSV
jgi:DNA-binding transcriptional LysR family regulator